MKKTLLLLALIPVFTPESSAQRLRSTNGDKIIQAEIPFEIIGGIPVFEVAIGGTHYNFIFDTGSGWTCVTQRVMRELSVPPRKHVKVGDSNNTYARQVSTVIPGISFSGLSTNSLNALVFDDENFVFKCLGVDGIVGSDIFRKFLVNISLRDQVIRIYSRTPDTLLNLTWHEMKHKKGLKPYLRVAMKREKDSKGREEYALFDSGNGPQRVLLPFFERFMELDLVDEIQESFGMTSRGIHGLGKERKVYQGTLPILSVAGADIAEVPVRSNVGASVNIGFSLLRMGDIYLDFRKNRYAFISFENPEPWTASTSYVQTAVTGGRITVVAVWDSSLTEYLETGDRIVSIGDTVFENPDPCTTAPFPQLLRFNISSPDDPVVIEKRNGEIISVHAAELL